MNEVTLEKVLIAQNHFPCQLRACKFCVFIYTYARWKNWPILGSSLKGRNFILRLQLLQNSAVLRDSHLMVAAVTTVRITEGLSLNG
jgi:hypothetical protein